MNPTTAITAESLLAELTDYLDKLSRGLDTLARLDAPPPAGAAREAVYRRARVTLYRYQPLHPQPRPVPLLICYALVNRPTVLDLQPERSLIRSLLVAGLQVYLVDWGDVGPAERGLTLADYIQGHLRACVDYVRRRHRLDAIDLLGVCQGGTFSLCFTALYPSRIRKLVTMVAPVDFHTPDNHLTSLTRHMDVERLVARCGGYLPGAWLNGLFLFLNPDRLLGWKYIDLVERMVDEQALRDFLRLEQWIFDSPDLAGPALVQFARDCFQGNALLHGRLKIGRRRVDLTRITQPLLNIYAERDHLVPPAASRALAGRTASRAYRELGFRGGHVGIYVSRGASERIASAIARWLHGD
ncbi:MAG TPA: class III poly(R)-hydroxyalkanoic acid synthase subunit PhaC [Candidatus Competibacteraceae bacterium]|nr:class III poly(R)-hydroxyalkanoic acid synthase subunit PhaC [Candidatus Competibacteraceae bacterium]